MSDNGTLNIASGFFFGGAFVLFISLLTVDEFIQKIVYISGGINLIIGLGIFLAYSIIRIKKDKSKDA
jgi:hypothetical protein